MWRLVLNLPATNGGAIVARFPYFGIFLVSWNRLQKEQVTVINKGTQGTIDTLRGNLVGKGSILDGKKY
jgi:hypothetical protein